MFDFPGSAANSWPMGGLGGSVWCGAAGRDVSGDGPVSKLSERLWSGNIDINGPDHPVQASGFISEEIVPGVLVYLSLASATRGRDR